MPRKTTGSGLVRIVENPWLVSGLILLLGLWISLYIANLDRERRLSDARSQVIRELATVRARLEGAINTVFSATSGLIEVIAYQGGISPDLFNALARQAIASYPSIRNIAIAPGNTVTLVHPLEDNRQVLGLHYETLPDQYAAVEKARLTAHPILSGPHDLVQGGKGLIARMPVFTTAEEFSGTEARYWGTVSVVTRFEGLLDAGEVHATPTLEVGLQALDDQGHAGALLRGETALLALLPVTLPVAVPGGAWQLVAIPKGGWPRVAVTESSLFYFGLVNSLLAAAFVWWLVAQPIRERRRNEVLRREMVERRRAEEELRLSEQKYASFFHLMPDMVGITRLEDGCFVEINPGFSKVSGWEQEEVIGRSSLTLGLWTPEARAGAVAIVREQGRLENYHFILGTKSGEQRDALMFLTPITVKGEDCLYFMARDVTDLKQAQRVLEQERTMLRQLLQTIPALIWMKDPQGVFLFCNTRMERLLGAREETIIGRTDDDFVDRKQADSFREHDRKTVAAGQPSRNEEWVTYADDGHRELLETVKTPVYDGDGRLRGVLGVAWDITANKRIEEELRQERIRFVNLVDSVDGVVWEADAETFAYTYVSKQAERLLGYPVREWYGAGFWRLHLHPEDRERITLHSAACTAKGEEHTLEYRVLSQDGRTLWVQDLVTVVMEHGRPRWRRGILVDITGKKEEEKQKAKLEDQLRQAQKIEAIGRLAGGVAHDFNNKLSVILGYADLLINAAAAGPDKTRGYLNQIVKAAHQSQEITQQLLAFSRKEVASPQVLDLNTLVRGARRGLGRLIREDIRFEVRLAEDLWPISMDPTQVDQVIMNLIVNGRDAMEGGGLLVVETANVRLDREVAGNYPEMAAGDYVRLTVSDTGCGMSAETRQHIFEPFYTTKETGKGTGLGLATVYGIVTQNGGLVQVESEPGAGATFKILFPRSETELREAAEARDESLPAARAATVLLVEDEETVRQMIDEMLAQCGYATLVAATPGEALAICADREQRIDLLLTDVIMPEMNGRELSRRIVADRPEIKVLFMSGYAADILPEDGEDGAMHLLKKPFSMQVLLQTVEGCLQNEGDRPKGSMLAGSR